MKFLKRLFSSADKREHTFDLLGVYLVIAREVPEDFGWFSNEELYGHILDLFSKGDYTAVVDQLLTNTVGALTKYPEISLDDVFMERLNYVVSESKLKKHDKNLRFIIDFYENQNSGATS